MAESHENKRSKCILVTGGSRGIGAELCRQILQIEGSVLYRGVREKSRSKFTSTDQDKVIVLDVCNKEQILKFSDKLNREEIQLDVIVCNAGVLPETDDDQFTRRNAELTMNVNYFGAKDTTLNLLTNLKEGGKVVFISSGMACIGIERVSKENFEALMGPNATIDTIDNLCLPFLEAYEKYYSEGKAYTGVVEFEGFPMQAYSFSKACVNAFCRVMSRQHPEFTFVSCTPGFVDTDMTSHKENTDTMLKRSVEKGCETPMHIMLNDVETGTMWGNGIQKIPWVGYAKDSNKPQQK